MILFLVPQTSRPQELYIRVHRTGSIRLDHLHLTLTQCYLSVNALACLPEV